MRIAVATASSIISLCKLVRVEFTWSSNDGTFDQVLKTHDNEWSENHWVEVN